MARSYSDFLPRFSSVRKSEGVRHARRRQVDRRLAAGTGDRREGRLRPPGVELSRLGHARRGRWSDGKGRLSRCKGALSSLRCVPLPVGDARPDRSQAQAARGRRFGGDGRARDDRPGLALWRLSGRRSRRGQRRDLSARDLQPRRSAFHGPRHRAGAVGRGAPHDRQ